MSMESAKQNLSPNQVLQVEGIHDFSLRLIGSQVQKSKAVTLSYKPLMIESKETSPLPRLICSPDSFAPLFSSFEDRNLLCVSGKASSEGDPGRCSPSRTPISQRSSLAKSDGQKPKPTSNYCQVCKERFEDYEEHIKHDVHLKNLKKNQFQKYIENLIEDNQVKSGKRAKSPSSFSREDSLLSRPKKRPKTQKPLTTQANFSIQNVNSTQSTTNSSAVLEAVEKRHNFGGSKGMIF